MSKYEKDFLENAERSMNNLRFIEAILDQVIANTLCHQSSKDRGADILINVGGLGIDTIEDMSRTKPIIKEALKIGLTELQKQLEKESLSHSWALVTYLAEKAERK